MACLLSHAERLRGFLSRSASLPFVWGSCDCALWVSDWLLEARGVDPGAAVRGTYSTAFGCARILRRGGGMLAMMEDHLGRAGLALTNQPVIGDVGVIDLINDRALVIRTAEGWVGKAPSGLLFARANHVAAWVV